MDTGNKMLGGSGNLRWSSNTPNQFHATETGISSGSVGQFDPCAALPLTN